MGPGAVAGPRAPGRAPARRAIPPALAAAGVVVAAMGMLAPAYLLVRALQLGGRAGEILFDPRTLGLLSSTLALTVAVTASAVAIGVPLAWITARGDLPGARWWTILLALPLVIPSYVAGFTFVAALGPRGILQGFLASLGVARLPSIYGFFGAWLVLTVITYPYVFLTARAGIRGLDPSLEEAARTLGEGRVFTRTALPQLRPAIGSGALLVALYTLHDFGAVSLLRFDTFTRAIYVSYLSAFDRSAAAVLALVLVALCLVVVGAESKSRRRADYHRLHGGGGTRARTLALGRWRWPAVGGCTLLALVSLGVPLGVIGYWMAQGLRAGRGIEPAFSPAAASLQIAALGTVAALVAAWPVAVLGARFPGKLASVTRGASYLGYVLPGLVVALALVFFGIGLASPLYQTRAMLVLAYLILFLPLAAGALQASLQQVSPALEEAARTLGRTRTSAVVSVVMPLVRPGMAAGAALVFLTAMKELPATLLLAPPGFSTLATRIWSATSAASFSGAAAPALALMLLAALPLAVLLVRDRRADA